MEKATAPLTEVPKLPDLKTELHREKQKIEYLKTLLNTLCILLAVAGSAVLVATLALPVLKVCGTSMEPTLQAGEIVVAIKKSSFDTGNVIAFYHNNKILLKRAIASAGKMVSIDDDGTVYVNGKKVEEPYITDKSLGQHDIDFPYQVPDGKVFVLGDQRSISLDSRSAEIGCVPHENIVGKAAIRIWPPTRWGIIA